MHYVFVVTIFSHCPVQMYCMPRAVSVEFLRWYIMLKC